MKLVVILFVIALLSCYIADVTATFCALCKNGFTVGDCTCRSGNSPEIKEHGWCCPSISLRNLVTWIRRVKWRNLLIKWVNKTHLCNLPRLICQTFDLFSKFTKLVIIFCQLKSCFPSIKSNLRRRKSWRISLSFAGFALSYHE